jgi:hypothetical protein
MIDKEEHDKRKGKTLVWKELKLCLAHSTGSNDPFFGGTFSGSVIIGFYQHIHPSFTIEYFRHLVQ